MFGGLGQVIKMRLILKEIPIRPYETRSFNSCAWMGKLDLRLVMKVRACLNGVAWRVCVPKGIGKILDAGIAALNSAWGIDVCLFVVCVGIGLETVT
jgi:hypothetical protein